MALELEAAQQAEAAAPMPEPPVQPPPEPEVAAEGDVTAMGPKPEAGDPAIEQAEKAEAEGEAESASDQAFDSTKGVHYWDEYKDQLEASGQESKWDDKYMVGHTHAHQWVQPYEGRYAFEWSLKKGQSASEAVQSWLHGLTIAEYRSVGVAVEIDEVRDTLGDQQFDRLFGSKNAEEDSKVPAAQRLKISAAAYTTPIGEQMKELAAKADAEVESEDKSADKTDGWEYYEREAKSDKPAKAEEETVDKKPVVDEATVEKQQ